MRKILVLTGLLMMAFAVTINAQTNPLTPPDTIALSANDISRPGAGANTWYTYTNSVQIPVSGQAAALLDNDTRFLWSKIQPTSRGVFVWTEFDNQMKYTIDHGQKMSFGIMPVCSSCIIGDLAGDGNENVGGYGLGYPLYLHTAMQAETVPDWQYNGGGNAQMLIPNFNSNSFLVGWEELQIAIANHLATTSYKGVLFAHAVSHIDVRGYGNWGEWHTYPWRDAGVIPAGAKATDASLERIIAAVVNGLNTYRLILMVGTFNVTGDASSADRTTAEVGYYALQQRTLAGMCGIRSDHLGTEHTDAWVDGEQITNAYIYNGLHLKDSINVRWQNAPQLGEPEGTLSEVSDNGAQCAFFNLLHEVALYHLSQFSNENLVGNATCSQNFYRAASKAAGYRLQYKTGSISNNLVTGTTFPMSIDWQNIGNAPVYENWNVTYELRPTGGGAVAKTWTSTANLKTFLPGYHTITDNFDLTGVDSGAYYIYLKVVDPNGYRKPMPIFITGVQSDGAYQVASVFVHGTGSNNGGGGPTGGGGGGTTGGGNQPPVATIATPSVVTQPVTTSSLNGSSSDDPDGSITAYAWVQVGSSPKVATITGGTTATPTLSGLDSAGTYTFQLTVTDNGGATAFTTATLTVKKKAPTSSSPVKPSFAVNLNSAGQLWVIVTRNSGAAYPYVVKVTGPGLATGSTLTVSGASFTWSANNHFRNGTSDPVRKGTYKIQVTYPDKTTGTQFAIKK